MIYIITVLILLIVSIYFIYNRKVKKDKQNLLKTNKKRIDNINKHLKIADASNNLHEVRIHARKAMKLINKYGLLEEYRKIFNNK